MRHLILGNGSAGVIAAETIRKNAPNDEILLLGCEPGPPYSRMAIPRLLSGHIPESATWLRKDPNHFAKLRIQQKRARAQGIDSKARKVLTDDGGALDFDRLLIATGASPARPPIPGIDSSGVHPCWTLHDARNIMQLVRPGTRVILIGAGFIGCILMEALAACRVRLTVVEKRDRMLPHMVSEGAGRMIRQWCEKKDIRVHASTRVTAIERRIQQGRIAGSAPLIARLSNGEWLDADLVVCATGVKPNIGFLPGSGIQYSQGVLVDTSMRTNVPGIYAAGDCAETFDCVSGRNAISAVQPNAVDQAYCAALNMTGKRALQHGVRRIDVLDTLGLISCSLGQWRGVSGGQWVEMTDDRNFRYLRLEFSQDVLVGSTTVGLAENSSMLRDLIRHRVKLGEWKDRLLQDPTRLKEAYRACVQQRYAQAAMYREIAAL